MFHHLGAQRSHQLNLRLAGGLSTIAGYVNSSGFVVIGSLTSHVTGNVGRAANDLASRDLPAALLAAVMVLSFFAGAFITSMAVESGLYARRHHAFAAVLLLEAATLGAFCSIAEGAVATTARAMDAQALLLCFAMGLQNSLVTRLSGAVVRTTHLTGVVTDLGIEAARWFRWWRHRVAEKARVRLAFGSNAPARPSTSKAALLLRILGGFSAGSSLGALVTHQQPRLAMLPAFLAVLGWAAYAVWARPVTGAEAPESQRNPE